MPENIQKILESLSPNERRILPHLEEKNVAEICKKANLDKVSVVRSLEYLKNKGLIKISRKQKRIVDVGVNGALYRKKGLPERRLLALLEEKRIMKIPDALKQSGLSEEEFKASLGALKKKAFIELKNGKVILSAKKEEISKKSLEEVFLESLPLEYGSLDKGQQYALESLKNRKGIVEIVDEKIVAIELTDLGKEIMVMGLKGKDLIEQITPETLKKDSLWRGRRFRRYDISLPLSKISGGKRHFVNQAVDYARALWTQMGFREMSGNLLVSSFWNFDALFTPQDHSARELQDTFFINRKTELPDKKIVKAVKESHEKGVSGSTGWNYKWDEEEAKKLVLRTHTTCLSAQTLAELKSEDIPAKFFAIGRCFRNETVDWSHGFEFNQTEGIVVDENANFRNLLGYLKEFARKMGFKKIRFRPHYFPYTEPSLEGDVWDEERKKWVEVFAAGIFRPEVTEPLLGKPIPVLAWGPGFDRMIMKLFEIEDMRDMYKNDLNQLRKMKFLVK